MRKFPHICIRPRSDPRDPRQVKTKTSIRKIPLVGISLEALKAHQEEFPRYKNKENSLSAALNKYLKENNLLQSQEHSVYSIRHAFEDRMKVAGIGDELRRILMGHQLGRERYGVGGTLLWQREQLMKIVLPFDPAII
jgi:hypothetical protein